MWRFRIFLRKGNPTILLCSQNNPSPLFLENSTERKCPAKNYLRHPNPSSTYPPKCFANAPTPRAQGSTRNKIPIKSGRLGLFFYFFNLPLAPSVTPSGYLHLLLCKPRPFMRIPTDSRCSVWPELFDPPTGVWPELFDQPNGRSNRPSAHVPCVMIFNFDCFNINLMQNQDFGLIKKKLNFVVKVKI